MGFKVLLDRKPYFKMNRTEFVLKPIEIHATGSQQNGSILNKRSYAGKKKGRMRMCNKKDFMTNVCIIYLFVLNCHSCILSPGYQH